MDLAAMRTLLLPEEPSKNRRGEGPPAAAEKGPAERGPATQASTPAPRPAPVALRLCDPCHPFRNVELFRLDDENTVLLYTGLTTDLTFEKAMRALRHANWSREDFDNDFEPSRSGRRSCCIGSIVYDVRFPDGGVKLHRPDPWREFPAIARLMDLVEQIVKPEGGFQYVVVQHYRDFRAGIGAHTDDENDEGAPIAGVSFGDDPRTLNMWELDEHDKRTDYKVPITLPNRSLYVISGKTNKKWMHEIPKQKGKEGGERLSFTFRRTTARNVVRRLD
ncbi:hypothetical protein DFJ74DRAFT_703693 [Hyaloraphidium curvatum]|nr:hypothetical protein DFJ74DRAFT_703693 [Hyaloraphidium curvatum]